MKKFKKKIETIMKDSGSGAAESFLYAFSLCYGSILKLRENFYKNKIFKSYKLPCSVISVGNITAGGTGKTPTVIYLARMLKKSGYKTTILSRGYKGTAEKNGGIVSNLSEILMTPEQAGDEPFMMAVKLEGIPVLVGRDRVKSGRCALSLFKPDVLILDDAFQHIKIQRDINLLLLDSVNPLGNRFLIPRGTLREPISCLKRADAFIITRSQKETLVNIPFYQRPVFRTVHISYIQAVLKKNQRAEPLLIKKKANIKTNFNGKFFAFSAVGNNKSFIASVKELGFNICAAAEFSDHHRYSTGDIEKIINSAFKAKADYLITTEKDYVKLGSKISFPFDLFIAGVKISFKEQETKFCKFVSSFLA